MVRRAPLPLCEDPGRMTATENEGASTAPVQAAHADDELFLTRRLIAYDTARTEGLRQAAEFVKGWLDARGIAHREYEVNGLPAIVAALGVVIGTRSCRDRG